MTSGGARGISGPAPDPNALRRDRDGGGWITLPAAGRAEPAPEWPLSRPTARETALWTSEWRRPQAVMWERNGQEVEVAMYVRSLATAEKREATVAARTLVRQQQEALGLSLPGLARNRWKIGPGDQPATAPAPAIRSRLKVVAGGAG